MLDSAHLFGAFESDNSSEKSEGKKDKAKLLVLVLYSFYLFVCLYDV